MSPRPPSVALLAATLLFGSCQGSAVAKRATPQAPGPKAEAPSTAYQGDPALLRRELLRRFDARIDAMAAQLHVEARLAIDEVSPIPYLGLDADPAAGGMQVTAVYGGTGASQAGLLVGDLLQSIGGQVVDSHAALARAIRHRVPGQPLELLVQRQGRGLVLQGVLGKRPEEDEDEAEQFPDLPGAHAELDTVAFAADFEHDPVGTLPANLIAVLGGHGEPPRWLVAEDGTARYLRQDSADRAGIHFPMALVRGYQVGDVVGRVRMRYAGGEVDKAGGIVLRYHDPGNYYVARVNAAEGDLRIFRVANGVRRTLPGGKVLGATNDAAWHTLEFRAEGSQLTATLDGKYTATAWDSYFLQGAVGLWTKSDSRTEFDDLEFVPSPH